MQEEEVQTGYTREEALDQMILCLQEMEFDERDDDPEKMKWMQTLYHALKRVGTVGDYVDARFTPIRHCH